jgi:hypothetical protein
MRWLERMVWMRRDWKEWLGRDRDGKNGWDEMVGQND